MNLAAPVIRRAEPGESAAVIPCYEWLFAPPGSVPPDWSPQQGSERLEATITNPEAVLLLAQQTEPGGEQPQIVGICSAYLDLESVRFGLRCWVEDLAVHPGCRSAGIGAELLAAARRWGAERGATHLELDSGIKRTDAHRFYERTGPAWTGKQYTWLLP